MYVKCEGDLFRIFIRYKRDSSVLVMFFFSVTCKSLWSCNALLELKYAFINRSKNSEFK